MQQEIELKFQVPPDHREAVDAAIAAGRGSAQVRLQAVYVDTASRALAQAGLALRLRREGSRWVQTLKGAGDDGITRAEHNVELAAEADGDEAPDPQRHAGTSVGDRLLALLAQGGEPLEETFRTDILRRTRRLHVGEGVVELAHDSGWIVAGDHRVPVCEIEIECVSGSPRAVMAEARPWVQRHGVWLDTRSKAERGDMLARGIDQAPHRDAQPVRLTDAMTLAEGARGVLRSCLDQISVNASQVATGEHGDEHVHQLRVGLRRLRSACSLFEPAMAQVHGWRALSDEAAWLFRELGAARDQVAIARPLEGELAAALLAAGIDIEPTRIPLPAPVQAPAAVVRSARAQGLLLDLLDMTQRAAMQVDATQADATETDAKRAGAAQGDATQADSTQADDASQGPSLRAFLVERLHGWHSRAARDARHGDALDDAARHRLRKRIKRLRYGVEFAEALFKPKRVRRYLKPLRALQKSLGSLVDTTLALDACRNAIERDSQALLAAGWLVARKQQLRAESTGDMKRFGKSAFKPLAEHPRHAPHASGRR